MQEGLASSVEGLAGHGPQAVLRGLCDRQSHPLTGGPCRDSRQSPALGHTPPLRLEVPCRLQCHVLARRSPAFQQLCIGTNKVHLLLRSA